MTVGIVVVSHSRALADAAVALAAEMLHGREAPIEVAAGMDDGAFGTDAVAIHDAVLRADHGDGVVVLMDLGSAVLSAELAMDFLDDDARSRVVLCPAPLVEGLIVAAVSADAGATARRGRRRGDGGAHGETVPPVSGRRRPDRERPRRRGTRRPRPSP